jgi:ligand-binding SRPBCC domain-containing protein
MIHIHETTVIHAPIERVFDLARSVEVHLLANIHSGEQALATGGRTSGLAGLGDQTTWRARHFGVWQNLTSEITACKEPGYFQVTMTRGIFRSMQADHRFHTLPSGLTAMIDDFRITAPIPLLGRMAEALFLRRYMLALVRERNAVLKRVAESSDAWQRYLPQKAVIP